ncbi:hypothetical protein BDP81DRAFT_116679 [Colletotrichum phormii]|uniref:Secreted protein n=1 Tax=Colletotrichum phormii TaxID=359342 RepID=A0AAI9ZFQ7_9PEZI|nr:uncharacterized protein BDP81DRAFT_116679 [Colletotrichum phormii]KAK1623719.1 hypothetical protein BDP81DRAFT_116679 [Colletotrichum phormii]
MHRSLGLACPCVFLFLFQTNPSLRLSAPLPPQHRRHFCLPGPPPKLLHKNHPPKSCMGKEALAPRAQRACHLVGQQGRRRSHLAPSRTISLYIESMPLSSCSE